MLGGALKGPQKRAQGWQHHQKHRVLVLLNCRRESCALPTAQIGHRGQVHRYRDVTTHFKPACLVGQNRFRVPCPSPGFACFPNAAALLGSSPWPDAQSGQQGRDHCPRMPKEHKVALSLRRHSSNQDSLPRHPAVTIRNIDHLSSFFLPHIATHTP